MRRLHIPFMLSLALYLVAHFGPRLRECVSNLNGVTQAQGRSTGDHYAPAENLERLDLAAVVTDRANHGVAVVSIATAASTRRRNGAGAPPWICFEE